MNSPSKREIASINKFLGITKLDKKENFEENYEIEIEFIHLLEL